MTFVPVELGSTWSPDPSKSIDTYRVLHDGRWWPIHIAAAEGARSSLVLLDADWSLGSAAEAVRWLTRYAGLEPITIIGIGFRSRGDGHAELTERAEDYTGSPLAGEPPADYPDADPGQADRLAEALETIVLPAVAERYGANSTTVLFGHSIGGLFVLNQIGRPSSPFSGYIASTPSVWWGDGVAAKALHEPPRPVRVLITVGDIEADYVKAPIRPAAEALAQHGMVELHQHSFPMINHRGAEAAALELGVQIMFDNPRQRELRRRTSRPDP